MGIVDRLRREYLCVTGALRSLAQLTRIAKNPNRTLPDVVEELSRNFAERPALVFDRSTVTYREYNGRANRYARWAMANGIKKGDAVALIMPNCPEYLAIWLGVARAGGVTALVNTNLSGPPLAHCINIVQPKFVLVDASLMDRFRTAEALVTGTPGLLCRGDAPAGWAELDAAVSAFSDAPIAADRPSRSDRQ